MGDKIRILALTRYSRLGASSRMRIYQYLPLLFECGFDVRVSPLLGDDYLKRLYAKDPINWFSLCGEYLRQVIRLLSIQSFDLIWIEKEIFPNLPAWFEQAFSSLGVDYVVDFDDAIFHNYDLSSHPIKRLLSGKIDKVMRGAALVVCGNNYLAERARDAGARQIEVIPTVIDLARYSVAEPRVHIRSVVGWMGSPSTVRYLHAVAPALRILASEFQLQLRVIGAHFSLPGLDVDCRPWSEKSEVSEIQDFDIGIMPLIDSPWEQGKCGYKLIQYMACGKPIIASAVGVNRHIVIDGMNGYLVTTIDDWVHAFRNSLSNKPRQLALGRNGRKLVEEKYQLLVTAPRLAQLFYKIVNKGVC